MPHMFSPYQEISAALWSSTLISPFMMVMDLSIHRSHVYSEKRLTPFLQTLRSLYYKKIPFLKSFSTIHSVYFLTFTTANLTEYYCKKNNIPSTIPIISFTTLVNCSMMTYKDRVYAQLHGASQPVLPWKSRFLSTSGALFTVYGQFVQRKPFEEYLLNEWDMNSRVASFLSSVTISMGAQIFSTPLHLCSMDIHRYPEKLWKERWDTVRQIYFTVCAGRILRILPAFGAGGYLNEQWKCNSILK